MEFAESIVLDLDGLVRDTGLSLTGASSFTRGRAVGPASGASSFGGGVGEVSSMLEHDEFLVIVGATELWPDELTDDEPVESLRAGRALRFEVMAGALCGWLAGNDVSGAKVGQAKSCAHVESVETFTKVLEAPSFKGLCPPSKLLKRSKRSINELVSTCEICGSWTDGIVTVGSSSDWRNGTGRSSGDADFSRDFMTRFGCECTGE